MLPFVKVAYLDFVELFVDCVGPFLNIYFLILLRRTIFHMNLKILLGNFTLGLCLLTIFRIPLLLHTFYNFLADYSTLKDILSIAHNSCVILIMDGTILLAVERIIATVYAHKYEHSSYTHLTITSAVLLWVFNIGIAYMSQVRMNQSHVAGGQVVYSEGSMQIPFDLIILLTLNISSVAIFLVVFFIASYNKRQFRASTPDHQLTKRFQISENIRTARQLRKLMIANVIINSYIFITLYFLSLSRIRNFYTDLITSCYEFVVSLSCVLFPVILIWTHPRLKHTVWKHFARLGCRNVKIQATEQELTQTINNLPLIVRQDAAKQKELYFDELQKSWQ
ncbi:hypothetical protein QR680_004302 [Steinernema hermaphroditum]|uniref:G-protein coupled receptors family 1 profile domain-containing protein n=1 Tax=Steinernema hermaphroditum TaxID=289476 RepID=A0AA39LSZ3_9BILA|nr:hypothetical protein QR680_004302 [Steinernema hermaphroditum]